MKSYLYNQFKKDALKKDSFKQNFWHKILNLKPRGSSLSNSNIFERALAGALCTNNYNNYSEVKIKRDLSQSLNKV